MRSTAMPMPTAKSQRGRLTWALQKQLTSLQQAWEQEASPGPMREMPRRWSL